MKTFKSKIGLELVIPLVIIILGIGSIMIYSHIWPGLVIVLLVNVFVASIMFNTYYQIGSEKLIIKCSFFFTKIIAIKDIIKISETRDPLSSPATSLDRLEIKYNNSNRILISPKEKQLFLDEVAAINKNVIIQLKK